MAWRARPVSAPPPRVGRWGGAGCQRGLGRGSGDLGSGGCRGGQERGPPWSRVRGPGGRVPGRRPLGPQRGPFLPSLRGRAAREGKLEVGSEPVSCPLPTPSDLAGGRAGRPGCRLALALLQGLAAPLSPPPRLKFAGVVFGVGRVGAPVWCYHAGNPHFSVVLFVISEILLYLGIYLGTGF